MKSLMILACLFFYGRQPINASNVPLQQPKEEITSLLQQFCNAAFAQRDSALVSPFLSNHFIASVMFNLKPIMDKDDWLDSIWRGKDQQRRKKMPDTKLVSTLHDVVLTSHGSTIVAYATHILTNESGEKSGLTPVTQCMFTCAQLNGKWKVASLTIIMDPSSVMRAASGVDFEITKVPSNIREFRWVRLKEDERNDGARRGVADGKVLSYFYEKEKDFLWFKFELFNKVDFEKPSATVSLDIDRDQTTGSGWWGTNREYNYDALVYVGPLERDGQTTKYKGNNGVTINPKVGSKIGATSKNGNVIFYIDEVTNSYIIGIKRTDISPSLKAFNIIGSVGTTAQWNDDFGDEGYSTIDLGEVPK